MTDIAVAVARSDNQPDATFRALEDLVHDTIGAKLFTLMEVDHDRDVAWRNYTNMPEAYPVLGEKPRMHNAWSDIVDVNHETFVANSIEEMAEVFGDYELIQSTWLRKLSEPADHHRWKAARHA